MSTPQNLSSEQVSIVTPKKRKNQPSGEILSGNIPKVEAELRSLLNSVKTLEMSNWKMRNWRISKRLRPSGLRTNLTEVINSVKKISDLCALDENKGRDVKVRRNLAPSSLLPLLGNQSFDHS